MNLMFIRDGYLIFTDETTEVSIKENGMTEQLITAPLPHWVRDNGAEDAAKIKVKKEITHVHTDEIIL